MLPDPLHPAVVHFPIVLAVLLPIAALGALLAIRGGTNIRALWAIPLGLAAALSLSAWFAERTGGEEEDRVEAVVPHDPLELHEERAELFVTLSVTVLAVMAAGMLGGAPGRAARLVGTVGAVFLLIPMAQVGSSGGDLVYEYGAAAAYTTGGGAGTTPPDNEGDPYAGAPGAADR